MLILIMTLVVTWVARNWWKILLLLIGLIVLHEYRLHKQANDPDKTAADTDKTANGSGAETGSAIEIDEEAENSFVNRNEAD